LDTYALVDENATNEQRRQAWEVGLGLQAVDALPLSSRIYELAEEQIAGRIGYAEAEQELLRYYSAHPETSVHTQEGDQAALRISAICLEPGFTMSPASLADIHNRIFVGLLPRREWEGQWRTENISKSEPVLGGNTVVYTNALEIARTLDYDFEMERNRTIAVDASDEHVIAQVLAFLSGVWQIHPFREGNTRAVATFGIKYLRSLGLELDNKPFAENAVYFRDALVLDNASRGRDPEPLRSFGRSLLDPGAVLRRLR
jgi:fido (protein-threonine AMPylation protein)